jgi:hypothetical protein
MAWVKASVIGLGSLALCAILWRLFITAFALAMFVLKLLVFVVLPIAILWWAAKRLFGNGSARETTSV